MSRDTNSGRSAASDWAADDAARYHRPAGRVEVRRRATWKVVLGGTARVLLASSALAVLAVTAMATYQFVTTAGVFRLHDLNGVEVVFLVRDDAFRFGGEARVPEAAVRERFAGDVDSNLFSVALAERRAALEEIAWVEAATVQRVLPNRLRVYLREREPVAFLRQGASLWLVDAAGVLLAPPEGSSFSFPVISGLPESLTVEERRARVGLLRELVGDLDADGHAYSARLSEVDLSDPDDVRASLTEADGAVWLHFGRGGYREKFETFLQNRPLWQESGQVVRSVDLRYRDQIVLNPDTPRTDP
jgi:cell division protein FtsQ